MSARNSAAASVDGTASSYVAPTPEQLVAARDWVQRFEERWRRPDADSLRDLMHADTRNLIPPMVAPGNREEVVKHFRDLLQRVPDFRLAVVRWAPVGDAVLLEWEVNVSVAGKPLCWRGVDRVSLREGKTYEGQVYWDTRRVAEMIAEAVAHQASAP